MGYVKFYPDEPWHRCRNCRIKFQRPKSKWPRGPRGGLIRPKFCSPECKREWDRKQVPIRNCQYCGNVITNRHCKVFCNIDCKAANLRKTGGNAGSFRKGHRPFNKGRHDLHVHPYSVKTQFKKGQTPANKVPVGTVRIRKNDPRDKKIAYIKVAEPNIWQERYRHVREQHNGPIPKGRVIRHLNGDPLDDRIENLVMITKAEHLKMTISDPDVERRLRYNQSLAGHKQQEALRRIRYHNGELPMRVYPVPLYVRMDRDKA